MPGVIDGEGDRAARIKSMGLGKQSDEVKRENAQARPDRRTQLLHRIFELGVLAKGIDGALELIGGVLLLVLSPSALRGTIFILVEAELKEDPTDLVANLLVHNTSTMIHSRGAASLFLLVHGAVKLGLVGGLATRKSWSYPAAILIFTGFTIYQLHQLAQQYSGFLGIVTLLDIIVVLSIAAEYRYVRKRQRR